MTRSTIDEVQGSRLQPWILALAVLGAAMGTAEILTGAMMPLMATGLNTTEGMIGQAVTASAIVAIIASLSLAKIVGSHDRRKILIIVTLLMTLSNIAIALSPNVWIMLGARLFYGAAVGVIWGLLPSVVLRLSPKGQFASSISVVLVGVSVAIATGAPLAAYLGSMFSWRAVYFGATVLSLGALLGLIFVFPSLPAAERTLKRNLRATFQLPGLKAGMLGMIIMFSGAQSYFGYLVPFLESVMNLTASAISLTLLATGISGIIGTIFAPKFIKISLHKVMVTCASVMAVLLALLQFTHQLIIPAMIILVLWSFGRANIGVGVNAWMAHEFPEHAEDAGGILSATLSGSLMLGAIFGGVLVDNAGPKAPPVAGAILLGLGALYCFTFMKPRRAAIEPEVLATLPTPPGPVRSIAT